MAPRKAVPYSSSQIKEKTGITFSLRIIPKSNEGADSKPRSPYALEPSVHTVSSLLLFRRLKKRNAAKEEPRKAPKKTVINRKRKGTTTTSIAGECVWCGVHKTAQWRKRCGIEWAKQIRIEARELSISNYEAEQNLMEQYNSGQKSHKFQKYAVDSNMESQAESGQLSDSIGE